MFTQPLSASNQATLKWELQQQRTAKALMLKLITQQSSKKSKKHIF
jgi:hypothetical protein